MNFVRERSSSCLVKFDDRYVETTLANLYAVANFVRFSPTPSTKFENLTGHKIVDAYGRVGKLQTVS